VFRDLRVRGASGTILWSYRTAAVLSGWTISRTRVQGERVWTLTATIARASPFELRQVPLLFTAPRERGFWAWPLLEPPTVDAERRLTVRVGPPEQ
jgi:hypothetical protein